MIYHLQVELLIFQVDGSSKSAPIQCKQMLTPNDDDVDDDAKIKHIFVNHSSNFSFIIIFHDIFYNLKYKATPSSDTTILLIRLRLLQITNLMKIFIYCEANTKQKLV